MKINANELCDVFCSDILICTWCKRGSYRNLCIRYADYYKFLSTTFSGLINYFINDQCIVICLLAAVRLELGTSSISCAGQSPSWFCGPGMSCRGKVSGMNFAHFTLKRCLKGNEKEKRTLGNLLRTATRLCPSLRGRRGPPPTPTPGVRKHRLLRNCSHISHSNLSHDGDIQEVLSVSVDCFSFNVQKMKNETVATLPATLNL